MKLFQTILFHQLHQVGFPAMRSCPNSLDNTSTYKTIIEDFLRICKQFLLYSVFLRFPGTKKVDVMSTFFKDLIFSPDTLPEWKDL